MCSGCAGNPEEPAVLECTSCGEPYDDEELNMCPVCKEPVCDNCRKAHIDECTAKEDCLS